MSRILNLFESGQLKIFTTCEKTISELRVYRYGTKTPNLPALNQEDHLLDCLKYVISIFEQIAISEDDHDSYDDEDDNDFPSLKNLGRDKLIGY